MAAHQNPEAAIASSSHQRDNGERYRRPTPGPRQQRVSFECLGRIPRTLRARKPHSTQATLQWLSENYQEAQGICIPRHVIYNHYCRYCQINDMTSVNAASFGKILRQKFNMLKKRRLGTRGLSTYHYHGIGIIATSSFYQEQRSRLINTGANAEPSPSHLAEENLQEGHARVVHSTGSSEANRAGALLPNGAGDAPSEGKDILLPVHFPFDLGNAFFTLYRAHCERLYHSIFIMNLHEVQVCLLRFWKGVPVHLRHVLATNVGMNLIGVCDVSLYGILCDSLSPSLQKTGATRFPEMFDKLSSKFENWLNDALRNVPFELRKLKLHLARNFCRGIKCLVSLNKMRLSVHELENPESLTQMLVDFLNIDLSQICTDMIYTRCRARAREDARLIMGLFSEFERLIGVQSNVQQFLQWLDTVVDRCVAQIATARYIPIMDVARNFLLVFVGINTQILRDLTLMSAKSLGTFQLLGVIFNDYLTHSIEILVARYQTEEMKRNITLDAPPNIHNNGFVREEQRDGSMYRASPHPPIASYNGPLMNQPQFDSSNYYTTHGPSQEFSSRVDMMSDTDISNRRQEFEEFHPLSNQFNQHPNYNALTSHSYESFHQDINSHANSSMYVSHY